jgi:hypothetical protein
MLRNALRAGSTRGFAALAPLLFGLPSSPAAALPLVSEVFYDAVGSDNGLSFVEIYGTPGLDLTGWSVHGVNGADGAVGPSLLLAGVIPGDGFFVIADDRGDGGTDVANADLILNFDFQNGPDSIELRDPLGVIDAVGYGVFLPGEVFAGEGAPAPDPPAGSSLARRFANADTGDNAFDFEALSVPTPGTGELAPVPEPGTGALLAVGLLGLARAGRRRSG